MSRTTRASIAMLSCLTLMLASIVWGAAGAAHTRGTPDAVTFRRRVYEVGPSVQQAVAADLNDDGTLDLAAVNNGARTISLLSGRGDGTFRSQRRIPAGIARPLAIATDDLDGDGHPDLVVVNGRATNRVEVLLGTGGGHFRRRSFRGGRRAQAVIAADLNGDASPDVVTADGTGGVSVFLGRGDGSLGRSRRISTESTMCSSVAAADLDGDGNLDLVTANSFLGFGASDHSVTILMGHGDGTFAPPLRYRHVGAQPTMVGIADLDGDGTLDLVTPNGGWPTHDVSILFGNGDGTFAPPVHRAGGPSPHAVTTADLNGDGAPDLTLTNLGTSYVTPTNQGLTMRLGKGGGAFGPKRPVADAWPSSITAADFDGDGRIDLAVPNELAGTVVVLINRP